MKFTRIMPSSRSIWPNWTFSRQNTVQARKGSTEQPSVLPRRRMSLTANTPLKNCTTVTMAAVWPTVSLCGCSATAIDSMTNGSRWGIREGRATSLRTEGHHQLDHLTRLLAPLGGRNGGAATGHRRPQRTDTSVRPLALIRTVPVRSGAFAEL
uniref:Uncharacterized protein n=1 Tax=Anopheles atroparvus TaxID=41427 RepID=A0A182J7Q6_ANOAO